MNLSTNQLNKVIILGSCFEASKIKLFKDLCLIGVLPRKQAEFLKNTSELNTRIQLKTIVTPIYMFCIAQ